jgi:homocysteine S-methyltransferase
MGGAAGRLAAAGVSLVGGCCGTTPADTAAMKLALRGRRRVPLAVARERLRAEERARTASVGARHHALPLGAPAVELPAAPASERLRFLREAKPGQRDPAIIVELDPPKGLGVEKVLDGARRLAQAGVSAITIGDSPLAVTRMSSVVTAHLVQQETGVPVVAHVSCRDRNLIGTQGLLMGAHALGLRAILGITGDPASIGCQPGATSVYDTNSFGLIELMARMNRGEPMGGQALGAATDFAIGVAFNPNGLRISGQLRRLKKKVGLGAHFAQTQPCYDVERVRAMYEQAAELGIPVFLGLLPLFNERMAAFVHNEVPGIDVPEPVVRRLEGLDKDAGREAGLEIVEEIVEGVWDVAHGFYVIPPFNSPRHALAVIDRVRAVAARKVCQERGLKTA